jgi:hypothetical protein
MNSVDYKQKYLKYKNKYLELKALEESKLNLQTGGVVYSPGDYVFFIPEDKQSLTFGDKKFIENGNITSLNEFTDYLGNCTKFLRVGKPTSSFLGDINNTYNTVYTNQGSGNVLMREGSKAASNVATVAKGTAIRVGDGINQASKYIQDIKERVMPSKENKENSSTIGSALEESEKIVEPKTVEPKTVEPKTGGNKLLKGGDGCDAEPIKLGIELLIGSENEYVNDGKYTKLLEIVKLINNKAKEPSQKIKKIIYVKKPIKPGAQTTIVKNITLTLNYSNSNDNVPFIVKIGS